MFKGAAKKLLIMDILDRIISEKKKEIRQRKERVTSRDLEKSEMFKRETISLLEGIAKDDNTGIIAEFKRESPSKGIINSESKVEDVCRGYFQNGASGVSVLTDSRFFGGSLGDLLVARESSNGPLLQKDFIIDIYQVIEAKAHGADAILLIASVLNRLEIMELAEAAKNTGMEILMEVHTKQEIDKFVGLDGLIGVNNRNLGSFKTDIENSVYLKQFLSDWDTRISESGIRSTDDIKYLREAGYNGFLIGENFMSNTDPVKTFSSFVSDLKS